MNERTRDKEEEEEEEEEEVEEENEVEVGVKLFAPLMGCTLEPNHCCSTGMVYLFLTFGMHCVTTDVRYFPFYKSLISRLRLYSDNSWKPGVDNSYLGLRLGENENENEEEEEEEEDNDSMAAFEARYCRGQTEFLASLTKT
ncbi:hypothetical protein M0802_009740 [Mischocyttarus mexicanus]|nr:hypothetical protein M0802_009740 [Mischocyttarus mexicanus]